MFNMSSRPQIISALKKYLISCKFYSDVSHLPQHLVCDFGTTLIPWVIQSANKPELLLSVIDEFSDSLEESLGKRIFNGLFSQHFITAIARISPAKIQGVWDEILSKLLRYAPRNSSYDMKTITWMIDCLDGDVCPRTCLRLELVSFLTSFTSRFGCILLPLYQETKFAENGCIMVIFFSKIV